MNRYKILLIIFASCLIVFGSMMVKTMPIIGVCVGLIGVAELFIALFYHQDGNLEAKADAENFSKEIFQVNRDRLYGLSIPMVVLNQSGVSLIINDAFKELMGQDIAKKGINYFELFNIDLNDVNHNTIKTTVFQDKTYAYVVSSFSKRDRSFYLLHFADVTAHQKLIEEGTSGDVVFGYILIDNYDDIAEQLSAGERSVLFSQIDVMINHWADRNNAAIVKYDSDHYLAIFTKKDLEVFRRDHFHILDEARELGSSYQLQVTLSIGIGISEEAKTIRESNELSHAALDIALARGGDQCVVREDDKNAYYGGKTEAKEKRTKVKARVKAHVLKDQISEASNVIIMGHQNPDMDCLGAAVGLLRACKCMNKEARFVLREINPSISALMDYLSIDEDYAESFIKPKEVNDFVDDGTLLIVVDTQSLDYVEMPDLVQDIEKIVVIDHHRASGTTIKNTIFSYQEAYASSTCELVTELLQYFDIKDILTKVEANALLAGLCMDTKMFTQKTGVRTFEAASVLKRRGGDTVFAKTMLQDDIETYNARSRAVAGAEFYYDRRVAISEIESDSDEANLIAAQSADELLNIRGVIASFIVMKTPERGIIISGRSLGKINVQSILEKLGGGGHMTMAGAQLTDVDDLQEAKHRVLGVVDLYMKESEQA